MSVNAFLFRPRRRVASRSVRTLVTLAAVVLLAACSGASQTVSPLDVQPVMPATLEVVQSLCPWDLQAMADRGVQAWYLTPPVAGGVLGWEAVTHEEAVAATEGSVDAVLVEPTVVEDGATLFEATFELRDDRGLQTGREFWRCDQTGLSLRSVETPTRSVRFEPALLVLPSTGQTGEAHGTLLFQQDGVETRMAWVWSWAAVPGQPIGNFDAPGVEWRTIASVLQAADETSSYEWLTTTTWLTESDLVVPALRTQRVRISGTEQERTEQLDRLVNR
jgi:hypothetical protein